MSVKRSSKTDFGGAAPVVMRERSFVRASRADPQKRRSQTMATIKGGGGGGGGGGKPTMEIYRPPNVRTDLPKLNVHAKEFTMNDLQPSKSSGNLNLLAYEPLQPLQHSKSSGNILRHIGHPAAGGGGLIPMLGPAVQIPLLHSASSGQLLGHVARQAHFSYHPVFTGHNQPMHYGNWPNAVHHHQQQGAAAAAAAAAAVATLKRSKSLGSADCHHKLAGKLTTLPVEDVDLTIFPQDDRDNLKLALDDPNQLQSRTLMDLVKVLLEKVVDGIRYCEPVAKLSVSIIEHERNQTFLESLLNSCQQWYQERDRILRGVKAGDGTRFTAFMWFLTEMCGRLKRRQLRDQAEGVQPELVLLSVLAKCCQACVSLPIRCLSETECLFFVLTSIGRDLETELPQQLEQLLASVRDGFLASAGAPPVRRTLLQLIELHASNWQLPGSSVLYYYPRIK